MSPILLTFADGTGFFAGLTITLTADLLLIRFHIGRFRIGLTILAVIGMALVAVSATPAPAWAHGAWLIIATAALITGNMANVRRNIRTLAAFLIVLATGIFGIHELSYCRLPQVTVPRGTTIYVIGDSISAGTGGQEKCWPTILAERISLPVVNLARPGARVETAAMQASGVTEPRALVILEIGGNDVIGGSDVTAFRNRLDLLVSSLRLHQHQVLMLELPLFPFQNAFGQAQRSIAARHGCLLLPKRCFAAVLRTTNGTIDGLHLSPRGHAAMAGIIANVIHLE
jgi:acyl-CoA thioesterase-1